MTALTDAGFYLPNTTTSVLTNGSGSVTSSRATTKNIFDNEGKLITVKSGGITFGGARCVQNWCSAKSEDLTHANWTVDGGGTKPSADTFKCANATIGQYIYDSNTANLVQAGQVWVASYRLQYVDIQYIQIGGGATSFGSSQFCNFDLINGDYTATGVTATMTLVSAGVWDVTVKMTAAASAVQGIVLCAIVPSQAATRNQAFVGDGVKSVKILRYQFENVTGQLDQTAGEYVSVGVLSAPWHGGGADGIKYFATNKDGSAIPDADMLGAHIDPASKTNSLLHCRDLRQAAWVSTGDGTELATNGGFDTDTNWVKSAGAGIAGGKATLTITAGGMQYVYQAGLVLAANTHYTAIVDTTEVSGSGGLTLCNGLGNNVPTGTLFSFTVSATGVFTFSIYTAGGAINDLGVKRSIIVGDYVWDINSISVQKSVVQPALTGTGIDGLANSCSRLTFKAAGATILQTITAAATAACSGFWVKRVTGTGTVEFTRDNVTWLDITSQLSTGDFYVAKIENTSVTNPVVGFRGGTVDDVIDVDAGLNHSGDTLTLPIFTTAAAVTRNAEPYTYQTASNFSDTAGTILATFKPTYDTWPAGSIVGKASFGLLASTANSGVQAADGTNTVSGAAGTPTGQRKIGARWSGSSLQAFSAVSDLSVGSAGSYDSSFNLSTIGLNTGAAGYIRDIAIFNSSLSDGEISSAWGFVVSGTLVAAESGSDIFSATGGVKVQGNLSVVESGEDSFSSAGLIKVQGSLTAVETGDTFDAEGYIYITGAVSAIESNDLLSSSGAVLVSGSLSITESESDVFRSRDQESFTDWLVNPKSIRCVLVEAVANISGSDATRYMSTKNYADTVAGRIYDPIVNAESVQLIERMSLDYSPSMSFGDVEIYNVGGELDSWLQDIWVNKSITVLVGDVRWLRSDFETIFSGTIEDIDSRSRDTLNIKVRDKLQRLNTPISETTLGGTSTNKNELIPLCFGECFNVTPLLTNPATLEYKVHGAAIESIIEVRDNGVPVAATKTIAQGKFTLSAQPFGQVTASVQGDKPTTWNKTVSLLVQRIVTGYGGVNKFVSGDLDASQLATFEAANTQPVGIYLSSRENTLSVCNQIASSVGAQLVMSRLGKLQLLKIELPASGTAFEIDTNDIVENSLSISQKIPVKAAFKVNYDKNWTVQEGLQTGIPEEHKDMYALEWLPVTSQDATVKSNYALAAEPEAVDTMLLTEANATTEATRLLDLYKTPRFVVTFTGVARLVELTLGQRVTLTYPRFGLDTAKEGQVIGLSIDWSNLTVKVEIIV
jgi:hypothetical protein